MTILGVTGHRPQKLAPVDICYSDKLLNLLTQIATAKLEELKPEKLITGRALGWDTACLLAAMSLDISVVAAVPFRGQQMKWPAETRQSYEKLLREVTALGGEVVILAEAPYSPQKMLRRDEYIVDSSDKLLALWDSCPYGGTAHTLKYASTKNVEVINVWDAWQAINPYKVSKGA